MNTAVTPFTAAIPEAELADLQQRLARTRWPEKEPCDDWEQGMPLAYSRELADSWANAYDWRRFETKLNGWAQFITSIDGIDRRPKRAFQRSAGGSPP